MKVKIPVYLYLQESSEIKNFFTSFLSGYTKMFDVSNIIKAMLFNNYGLDEYGRELTFFN